ncbi:hypothetical protein [Homoserinimonas hongtaonis]|uniref:hypothetical protein n=1 Tax=Homoserinimonas hongtaonis TaxID=2079791 RepID=UPI0011B1E8C3|nr:hypothetical protein [Salinibacterium hongtaonis]
MDVWIWITTDALGTAITSAAVVSVAGFLLRRYIGRAAKWTVGLRLLTPRRVEQLKAEGRREIEEHAQREARARQEERERLAKVPVPDQTNALPKPSPRWHLGTHGRSKGKFGKLGAFEFHLANGVADSVARQVRVDGVSRCQVWGDGTWADMSGETKELFEAHVDPDGFDRGIEIRVTWFDEMGSEKSEVLFRKLAIYRPEHS